MEEWYQNLLTYSLLKIGRCLSVFVKNTGKILTIFIMSLGGEDD